MQGCYESTSLGVGSHFIQGKRRLQEPIQLLIGESSHESEFPILATTMFRHSISDRAPVPEWLPFVIDIPFPEEMALDLVLDVKVAAGSRVDAN